MLLNKRARGWCFTANLKEDVDNVILDHPISGCRYQVWQYERVNHLHIQGYIYFDNARTGRAVKTLIADWCGVEANMRIAKGSAEDNKVYCTKEDSRVEGPFEAGDMPAQGNRTDLSVAWERFQENGVSQDLVDEFTPQMLMYGEKMKRLKEELRLSHWVQRKGYEPPEVYVLWGPTGTGKTRRATEDGAVLCEYDSRYQWGHYEGEPVVCFDEFKDQIPLWRMLRYLDGHKSCVQIPYHGNKPWIPKKIYICSNFGPREWWTPEVVGSIQFAALERRFTKVEYVAASLGGQAASPAAGVVTQGSEVSHTELL